MSNNEPKKKLHSYISVSVRMIWLNDFWSICNQKYVGKEVFHIYEPVEWEKKNFTIMWINISAALIVFFFFLFCKYIKRSSCYSFYHKKYNLTRNTLKTSTLILPLSTFLCKFIYSLCTKKNNKIYDVELYTQTKIQTAWRCAWKLLVFLLYKKKSTKVYWCCVNVYQ